MLLRLIFSEDYFVATSLFFNAVCLTAMLVFGSMVMYRLHQNSTKLILGFICFIDVLRSLVFPILCFLQLGLLSHPFVKYTVVIWPFLKNSDFYFTVYCVHRFAVIENHLRFFHLFKKVSGLSCILLTGVIYGYLIEFHTISPFLASTAFLFAVNHYVVYFVVRFVLMVGQTSLHWFAIRSIAKKLDETATFLKSLPGNDRYQARLQNLAKIKRFNKALFLLQILMPTLEILRHVFYIIFVAAFVSNSTVLEIEQYLLPHITSVILSTRSIIFVTLHFFYFKVYSCCAKSDHE